MKLSLKISDFHFLDAGEIVFYHRKMSIHIRELTRAKYSFENILDCKGHHRRSFKSYNSKKMY
jgi:hypothetical protein